MEIELRVADVDRSRRFYRDLIGVPLGELEAHGTDTEQHAHATWGDRSGADPSYLMHPQTVPASRRAYYHQ